jgi:hypothetical protein
VQGVEAGPAALGVLRLVDGDGEFAARGDRGVGAVAHGGDRGIADRGKGAGRESGDRGEVRVDV